MAFSSPSATRARVAASAAAIQRASQPPPAEVRRVP